LSHPSQTYGFVNIGLFKTVGLKTVGLKTVGFVNLIFQRPQIFFSQLRQFSSDFDVSYHFGIRRPNKNH